MLTSRDAELTKRDRLNTKGKDGGSFIPRAVLFTGTTKSTGVMEVSLPNYINFDNFLGAFMIIQNSDVSDNSFIINFGTDGAGNDYTERLAYSATNNSIKVSLDTAESRSQPFKLTVFYKG